MMNNSACIAMVVSCPVNTVKAAVSFAFTGAVRFFSVLRFYFSGYRRFRRKVII